MTISDSVPGFTITRDIPASRAKVWEAWTMPDIMARWFHPEGLVTPRDSVSVDLREGGRYQYTMRNEESGEDYVSAGVYRKVDPPRRLDFTWGTPGGEETATLITVELEELDGRTHLTFTLTGLPNDSGADDSVFDGWTEALGILGRTL